MDNIDQLIAQVLQVLTNIFHETSRLTDQIFISGILKHLWLFLQAIIQFIIIALEALVKILKFFVH